MGEHSCIGLRVALIEGYIQEEVYGTNLEIELESTIFSTDRTDQSETLAETDLVIKLKSGLTIWTTIEFIYDYFGFVGIHILPKSGSELLGIKPKRAKGSLRRVIKSFVGQLLIVSAKHPSTFLNQP